MNRRPPKPPPRTDTTNPACTELVERKVHFNLEWCSTA